MRKTPMKRTAWPRRFPLAHKAALECETNVVAHGVEFAPIAIKKIVKCSAKMTKIDGLPLALPKEPKPWRNRAYLMLVASLECYHCRLHGHSQAAHPNSGKTKGRKKCDSKVFPMCCVSGRDHHTQFDQYKLVSRADMPAYEHAAYVWTVKTLIARGMWPLGMPIPDLRTFDA